jgi:hypothetical protein
MEQRIIYVGLDVHKNTIAVALAEAGKRVMCASMARSRTHRFWPQPKSSVIAFVRSPLSATFSRAEGASLARRRDCRPPAENSVAVSIDAARRRAD